MKDRVLQLLREKDSFAAIESALSGNDPLAAVAAVDELMRDLYWKEKNVAAALALGRAAAQHALLSAARETRDNALELRGKAKAICYNIASFAWRGWGEEGIVVTAGDEKMGLDAARANLRLAEELHRGDLPMSRAYWMLGGQQLSAGDFAEAANCFRLAAGHANAVGKADEELLAKAFIRLTELLEQPADSGRLDRLREAVKAFDGVENGKGFVQQVASALKVYSPTSPPLLP